MIVLLFLSRALSASFFYANEDVTPRKEGEIDGRLFLLIVYLFLSIRIITIPITMTAIMMIIDIGRIYVSAIDVVVGIGVARAEER